MIDVRRSTRFVVRHARLVDVDGVAAGRVSKKILRVEWAHPTPDETCPFRGDTKEQTAMWILVLDSVNFSFWPDAGTRRWTVEFPSGTRTNGYWALAAALKRGVRDAPLLDPRWLATLSEAQGARLFRGPGKIPLMEERIRALREIGIGLLRSKRSVFQLVRGSKGDVVAFIDEILDTFPLFRDEATLEGCSVGFYKRAQILCNDLALALSAHRVSPFRNLAELTAFADYKIPQLLRDERVLRYDGRLSRLVDAREILDPGSREEVEIRASTIYAVELIRDRLAALGVRRSSATIDNILWTEAVRRGGTMKPHHRVRTTNY